MALYSKDTDHVKFKIAQLPSPGILLFVNQTERDDGQLSELCTDCLDHNLNPDPQIHGLEC